MGMPKSRKQLMFLFNCFSNGTGLPWRLIAGGFLTILGMYLSITDVTFSLKEIQLTSIELSQSSTSHYQILDT